MSIGIHSYSHVSPNLREAVLEQVLQGIKDAVMAKKRDWCPQTNMRKFTREMYAVVKFTQLLVLPDRQELDLGSVPQMLRTRWVPVRCC